MPEVSIVVPVYKVEKYINKCLDSIKNQTFKDFEVILVDDGSPDECPAICDEYAKNDNRFIVIHKENGGVSAARNTGIESANGEWLYFVDSDDWLELDALENLVKEAEEQNVECVITDGTEQYSTGESNRLHMFSQSFRTEDKSMIEMIQKTILCHKFSPYYSPGADNEYPAPWTKFFRRELITKNDIRFDPYVLGQYDDGLFSIYLLDKVNSLYYDNRQTYNYRIIRESITRAFNKRAIECLKRNSERMDQFIDETQKNGEFRQAEYCRRISYFAASLSGYFFSPNNPASQKEVSDELRTTISTYPFDMAFQKAPIEKLENKHKYILICGRIRFLHGFKLYATLREKFKG